MRLRKPFWRIRHDSAQNLLDDLSYRLADACESAADIFDKGLIIAEQHGYVEPALPRFTQICKYYV